MQGLQPEVLTRRPLDNETSCLAVSPDIYANIRSTVILLVLMFSFNQKEVISQSHESQSVHAGMLTWQRRLAEDQSQHQNGGKFSVIELKVVNLLV